ncbi:MAG: hypothetical protein U0V87_03680 [Acidobacteriota bacterium]
MTGWLRSRHRWWLVCVLGFVAAAWLVVTASSEQGNGPDLAGTQPADGRGNPALPSFSNEGAPGTFLNPSRCAGCHSNFHLDNQRIYEPFNTWAGSMMANSARDPLFWAALDIANQDDKRHLGNVGVGDFCIRCHVPKAWYEGRSDCNTSYGQKFDGACLSGSAGRRDSDFEGITCAVCHRAYDASSPPLPGDFVDAQAPYQDNGQLYLTQNSFTFLGPFSDARSNGHGTMQSTLHKSAAFCGQCHNITNPVKNQVDPITGADTGRRFPIERTYREWQRSRFGLENRTCQSCHMPEPDHEGDGRPDPGVICTDPPGIRGRNTQLQGPLHMHMFRGGSVWMQGVLKGEYGDLLRRRDSYDAAIASALQMLQQQTATLAIDLPAVARPGSVVRPTMRITNLGGHKFPTGYSEGRRAWINVQAGEDRDGDGTLDAEEISFESGGYDAETGDLTRDPQVKVYEMLAGVFNYNGDRKCDLVDAKSGREMFHFALNDCLLKDNRIPPQGFVPDEETEPVGYSYPAHPTVPGTLVHWDDTLYSIDVPKDAFKPFLIVASLYYQTSSKEYVEFLSAENESSCDPSDPGCDPTAADERRNRGEKLHALWEKYGRSAPVLIARAQKNVTVGTYLVGPGEAGRDGTLRVDAIDKISGDLSVSFAAACGAQSHTVYWGDLEQVANYRYSGAACIDSSEGRAQFNPGSGSSFFMVVGRNSAQEGPLGIDAYGERRPEPQGVGSCDLPQSPEEDHCAP